MLKERRVYMKREEDSSVQKLENHCKYTEIKTTVKHDYTISQYLVEQHINSL